MIVHEDALAGGDDLEDEVERLLDVAWIVARAVQQWETKRIDVGAAIAKVFPQAEDGVESVGEGLGVEEVADGDLLGAPVYGFGPW